VDLTEPSLAEYERDRASFGQLFEGLDETALRSSPLVHRAALAWYWWNRARVEDIGFAQLIRSPQVIDVPGWLGRLDVIADEAEQPVQAYALQAPVTADTSGLSQRLNLVGLRAYWDAVGARIRQIIAQLAEGEIDSPIDASYVSQARGTTQTAVWTTTYSSGRTARGRLRTPVQDVLRSKPMWTCSLELICVARAIKRGRR
jgi:hypothetical protein